MRYATHLKAFAMMLAFTVFAGAAWAQSTLPANLPAGAADEEPEVTTRVVRVSYLDGTASIKRVDGESWEKLVLNLPIVEGDEIALDADSRAEIQMDKDTHLRLGGGSNLRFVKLADDAVALSLSQGSVTARLRRFDRSASFEVDAPGTTVAFLDEGLYRIDAGNDRGGVVRVSADDRGEARVYSQDSGLTIKSGRYAELYLDGGNAGQWDTGSLASGSDALDSFTADRDSLVLSQLNTAYYNKYYDDDIYGADDLDSNGEWMYTRDYGYVWRPYASSISSYSDWSPYRYGQWRWVPPYGWTWVNDEPWGWAIYHYGRWVYLNNYWAWTPYGYFRPSRSWWRPAMVVIGYWGNSYSWYPLPWGYGYYDYNYPYYSGGWGGYWGHHGHGGHHGNGHQGGNQGGGQPGNPSNPTNPTNPPTIGPGLIKGPKLPPLSNMPTTAVVTADGPVLGSGKTKTPPLSTAKQILSQVPDQTKAIKLPPVRQSDPRTPGDVRVATPVRVRNDQTGIKVGAATRNEGSPLDKTLKSTRIQGGRPPMVRDDRPVRVPAGGEPVRESPVRQTGVFDRPQPTQPVRQSPVRQPLPENTTNDSTPIRQSPVIRQPTEVQRPVRVPQTNDETRRPPVRQPSSPSSPSYSPPSSSPSPTRNTPSRPSQPSSPPKSETRNAPSPKSDTAPTRKGKD